MLTEGFSPAYEKARGAPSNSATWKCGPVQRPEHPGPVPPPHRNFATGRLLGSRSPLQEPIHGHRCPLNLHHSPAQHARDGTAGPAADGTPTVSSGALPGIHGTSAPAYRDHPPAAPTS